MTAFPPIVKSWSLSVFIVILACATVAADDNTLKKECRETNYHDLTVLLGPPDPSEDFVALTDFEANYEKSAHMASIEYLNAHPELVGRICNDLGTEKVNWTLKELSHRLMYAPERREAVSEQFTSYCRETIADVLDQTGLANPYNEITVLPDERPTDPPEKGIDAYIVKDLAREYEARYEFSASEGKRVAVDLTGQIQLNEVGSYASYLHYSEEHKRWEFTEDRHTIWKCASTNPYTVLMTPLEETLHIALRKHTEQAIMTAIEAATAAPTQREVEQIVEEWMAVEEAVVGGLVYKLAPDVVLKRVPDLPLKWIDDDLKTKDRFEKYRLLRKGIAWVEAVGLRESIQRYAKDPAAVRCQLIKQPG